MESLLEECDLDSPEEKHIQIIDRCLQLVQSDKGERTIQLGYLMLARILEKCSPQVLRQAQSRLAKRLAQVANSPSVHSALFLRQLLVRNPQVGELHSGTIDRILISLLDMSIATEDETLQSFSIELFSIRYGCSNSHRLLTTLEQLLRGNTIQDEAAGLPLKTFGMSQLRPSLMNCLFKILASCILHSKQGDSLTREHVLTVLELGLKEKSTRDEALRTIQALSTHTGMAALPIIPRLVSLLISQLDSPCSALFDALSAMGTRFGASSSLHKHFYIIFSSMSHPLTDQSYGPSASNLLSAVIRSSSFLIKPEVLISVQKSICEQAIRNPTSSVYRNVLESLLSSTHELVPVPIQLARTLVDRSPECTSSDRIAALCDVISRPRIQNLAFADLQRRVPSQISSVKVESGDENSSYQATGGEGVVDQFDRKVEQVLKEIDNEKETREEEMDTAEEVRPEEEEDKGESVEREEAPTLTAVKRTAETAKLSTPSSTKKIQKKKKNNQQAVTILQEGEASVDDILSSFCPS